MLTSRFRVCHGSPWVRGCGHGRLTQARSTSWLRLIREITQQRPWHVVGDHTCCCCCEGGRAGKGVMLPSPGAQSRLAFADATAPARRGMGTGLAATAAPTRRETAWAICFPLLISFRSLPFFWRQVRPSSGRVLFECWKEGWLTHGVCSPRVPGGPDPLGLGQTPTLVALQPRGNPPLRGRGILRGGAPPAKRSYAGRGL